MNNKQLFKRIKVHSDKDDENLNKSTELAALATEVFERNESGKKLLKCLKDIYISDRYKAVIFPTHPSVLAQFGSVDAYVGFKSGQANVIFNIEELINQFKEDGKKAINEMNEMNEMKEHTK